MIDLNNTMTNATQSAQLLTYYKENTDEQIY
jgi:hypothetical protein